MLRVMLASTFHLGVICSSVEPSSELKCQRTLRNRGRFTRLTIRNSLRKRPMTIDSTTDSHEWSVIWIVNAQPPPMLLLNATSTQPFLLPWRRERIGHIPARSPKNGMQRSVAGNPRVAERNAHQWACKTKRKLNAHLCFTATKNMQDSLEQVGAGGLHQQSSRNNSRLEENHVFQSSFSWWVWRRQSLHEQ